MSAPVRMMTTITSAIMIIIGIFFLFLNTSLDDQRSSSLRQIATTNLNRKAIRKLPSTDMKTNQKDLSQYSINQYSGLPANWSATVFEGNSTTPNDKAPVYKYEQAVWEQVYARFGDKLDPKAKSSSLMPSNFGSYSATSRTITWSLNGTPKGTLIFSYLYQGTLSNVYAVKVQTMISNRPYTINLAIVHDSSNVNFGDYSGAPILNTQVGSMSSNDRKSGESIAKTYTTDTGYNVVWDTEFVQKLKYGMDRIKLTYTFNQDGLAVEIPKSLKQIYSNISDEASPSSLLPVRIMQSTENEPITIEPSQVQITNGTRENPTTKIEVTLTKEQSTQFFNLYYNDKHKLLFRAYTHVINHEVSADYATGQAKLDTLDKNGNIIQTQIADASKVRITPFAVQPIDTTMSVENVQASLTHFVNKIYPAGSADTTKNNSLAQAQFNFAKSSNSLYAVR